jgi:hypothetical protein
MIPLMLTLHIFLGSTLAGSVVIAALVMGYDSMMQILVAAVLGFVAAFPLSVVVAKKIS